MEFDDPLTAGEICTLYDDLSLDACLWLSEDVHFRLAVSAINGGRIPVHSDHMHQIEGEREREKKRKRRKREREREG